jgi:excinuclease ABC subunit C
MEKEKSPDEIDLREAAGRFPGKSGVYLMRDARGSLLYIGKAKNLRNRVRSYFSGDKDRKTEVLVRKVRGIEYILTENEYEALLLENTLIKEHNPRYNINLKDGKSYPVIRITKDEYPRIFRTRRIIRDGSEYYGPFPAVQTVDTYLDLVEKIFPLRKCRGALKKREHPCLYYHIGRCSAPCAGLISGEDYRKNVDGIRRLLSGETEAVAEDLRKRMEAAAENLQFEKAAELRDILRAIEVLEQGQKVVDFDEESRDYIDWAAEDRYYSFIVFQMRGGRLLGRESFRTRSVDSEDETLEQFLLQYYTAPPTVPAKIFLPRILGNPEIPEYFRRELGRNPEFQVPEEKRDRAVIRLVRDNAEHDLRKRLYDLGSLPALEELKAVLGLKKTPLRIEGFDIAQLSGKHPAASMVSFLRGIPEKKEYRRYHIKTLGGAIDDYEAIREVVARRYTRTVNEAKEKPDLVVIDGGKGQVGAAREILDALGLKDVPVLGLAKRNEEIFLPRRRDPVRLPEGSPALRILQAVRDEAHRFATGFNKKLREKTISLEELTSVPGIGEVRGKKLLRHFGSKDAVARAEGYDIAKTAGISLEAAETLKTRLQIPKD